MDYKPCDYCDSGKSGSSRIVIIEITEGLHYGVLVKKLYQSVSDFDLLTVKLAREPKI